MCADNNNDSHMTWECPSCRQMVRPNYCFYRDLKDDDDDGGVVVDVANNGNDKEGYDRFERAVERLELHGGYHDIHMATQDELEFYDWVSCRDFEAYVDALLSGKEWSWPED